LRNFQTSEITTEPSPTEEATRFVDPDRTLPTAKMLEWEVAYDDCANQNLTPHSYTYRNEERSQRPLGKKGLTVVSVNVAIVGFLSSTEVAISELSAIGAHPERSASA
jgi:hypothetical protein